MLLRVCAFLLTVSVLHQTWTQAQVVCRENLIVRTYQGFRLAPPQHHSWGGGGAEAGACGQQTLPS